MATSSVSGSEKDAQTLARLICSSSLADGPLIYLSAFNIVLSITAFVGNTLILVALQKDSSLHPPSKLLFRCLATTDLCVGLITEPLFVTYLISLVYQKRDVCRYTFVSSSIAGFGLSAVSLLTVTAISVDRLLALLLGLRYRQVVTSRRTRVVVVIFWVISSAAAAAASYPLTHLIMFWYGSIIILLCAATSFVAYTKIFLVLRQHQTRVQDHQPSQTISLNITRNKKAVSSALWVQLALLACYLPYGIIRATIDNGKLSSSSFIAWEVAKTLVYLNSSLNPFLYCWKISGVKQTVKETIKQAVCCLSN